MRCKHASWWPLIDSLSPIFDLISDLWPNTSAAKISGRFKNSVVLEFQGTSTFLFAPPKLRSHTYALFKKWGKNARVKIFSPQNIRKLFFFLKFVVFMLLCWRKKQLWKRKNVFYSIQAKQLGNRLIWNWNFMHTYA